MAEKSTLSWAMNMGHIERKSVLEHIQDVQIQIILHMHKVSSRPLLSIHTFCSIQSFYQQTGRALSDCMDTQADLGLRCLHMPEDMFSHGAAHVFIVNNILQGEFTISSLLTVLLTSLEKTLFAWRFTLNENFCSDWPKPFLFCFCVLFIYFYSKIKFIAKSRSDMLFL